MTSPTLYLIDGSGFIFRAFFALPPMTRSDGTPVNAVYGYCSMLQKLLLDVKAEHMIVLFDAARKTFRSDIYPAYKANRPEPPEELVPQFALIREATRAFGLTAIDAEGYEADDLIASYAREGLTQGFDIRVVSSDKDLMQLVRDGVRLYDPMKSIDIGTDEVLAKFGVPPHKVVDVQALAGDSTDNVPGIPGIGIKTAAQLINEYGSLEELLARANEIKQPKRRELLTQQAELARISKKLVTLDAQTPLPLPLAEAARRTYSQETLLAFLSSMNFKSLVARFSSPSNATPDPSSDNAHTATPTPPQTAPTKASDDRLYEPPAPTDLINAPQVYECVQDRTTLEKWVAGAKAQGFLAIDTETTSLTPSTTTLVGISLALAPGRACYIPVNHIDPHGGTDGGFSFTAGPQQIALHDIVAVLAPLLADPSVIKIGHNLKFDCQVLAQHGLLFANIDDTMLMSYCIAAGAHGHGLDELAKLHLQHEMIAYNVVTGTGRTRITFDRVPLDQATDYAAEDADFTLRLWHYLKSLLAQNHVMRVYERIERPLVPVIAAMETAGVVIDAALLRTQSNGLAQRQQKLGEEIHLLAGHPFNIASPKQLGEVLFGELGLQSKSKGKTGAFSTSVDVLEPLAEGGSTIVQKILDWRGLAKLQSTYTDALPAQIDPKTHRVHTSFSMVGAATGRLSSTDPNLQNIPVRSEDGRAIRQAFIAPAGKILLSADYSQIELRLAAHAANITALIEAFAEGSDIHALTASRVFGVPLAQMTPEIRRQAKAVNFGIIYGISGFGLAKQLGCSVGEASSFIKAYLDKFHELRDWMEETKAFAHTHGFVETLFGRRIHLQGIEDMNAARRAFAERQAINAPLQGTAADIMKRAMIRIHEKLAQDSPCPSAKCLVQVHDELIFEVAPEEKDALATLVRAEMEGATLPVFTPKVPLIADIGTGASWAEAH